MKRIALLAISMALFAAAASPAHAVEHKDAMATVEKFKKGDDGMKAWFDKAYGYAVFPSVGKGAIGIGGAHGKGLVYRQGELVGKTKLTQISVGFQFGGQAFSEVIFFKNKTAIDDFMNGNFEFSAQASAVALTAGASADLNYRKGVAVVTATKGGLMYEAAVGGQKFSYEPMEKKKDSKKESAKSEEKEKKEEEAKKEESKKEEAEEK